MQISRRDALMGAGAAAVVASVPEAVGANDPAIDLAEQLNTASKAWDFAHNTFEDARHRVGLSCFDDRKALREFGIEPLWQEKECLKARYWDLRARLLDTPATTPRGVVAKLRGFYHDDEITQIRAGDEPEDDLPKEFAASIYRDLERLAGEA